jgi:hypothetical protein
VPRPIIVAAACGGRPVAVAVENSGAHAVRENGEENDGQ